jgi:hypothetical protein
MFEKALLVMLIVFIIPLLFGSLCELWESLYDSIYERKD